MRKEVIVPDSLGEITLGQYQKYLKIQADNEDEKFLAVKMVEIFCGIRGDLVMKMKATSIGDITSILASMFEQKPDLLKEFEMNGITYGFIPHLDDMSFGEYVDLDTYIGDTQNLHKAMGVLYRPIIQRYSNKYLIEEYKGEESDKMKNMPMDAVLGSMLFFYHLGMDLSKIMLNYLENNQEENQNLVQHLSLGKNGGGINRFSHSLNQILQELKISLN
ncbi:MAG: hypothetical protein GOVbin2950_27 [Prokaryotic dsDNA virus sp.]|nr:MAG: hypothetical protein GOVbin2950_27 [Prokaryotic dsDNA virus sp.]|tara:strand:- start:1436 stop:2092 length:657 start_codon:yes stop_codon:yes gene_type:complete